MFVTEKGETLAMYMNLGNIPVLQIKFEAVFMYCFISKHEQSMNNTSLKTI